MNIDNITSFFFQHVFFQKSLAWLCVVQFSDLASLMFMSIDSVSYIHCPSKNGCNKYIGFQRKGGWPFTQGFVIQLLQHSWLYLLVNVSFLTGLASSEKLLFFLLSLHYYTFLALLQEKPFHMELYDPLKCHAVLSESPQILRKKKKLWQFSTF